MKSLYDIAIDTLSEMIKVNKNYDLALIELDSVIITEPDRSYYFKFDDVRGSTSGMLIIVEDQYKNEIGRLEFEDFNYKPFRPLNLKGLYYLELK